MQFNQTTQPKGKRGRPAGSRNKRALISDQLHDEALAQLTSAVSDGEQWAIESVLKRTMPALKPSTCSESLDAELLKAQIQLTRFKLKELSDFEERLSILEGNK